MGIDRRGALAWTDRLTFVPVDRAREGLDHALAGTGHDPGLATTWVWEGVVRYLTPHDVDATVAGLSARSAPGSVLVVNYQSPSLGRPRWAVGSRD